MHRLRGRSGTTSFPQEPSVIVVFRLSVIKFEGLRFSSGGVETESFLFCLDPPSALLRDARKRLPFMAPLRLESVACLSPPFLSPGWRGSRQLPAPDKNPPSSSGGRPLITQE